LNQKEIRSQLLQEKAAPFSLCIGIGMDGEGILYLSPFENPADNMKTLSDITTAYTSDTSVHQGCLVSAENINLINQTAQAVIESLELAKETATPWLRKRKLEEDMTTVLRKIKPGFNNVEVSHYTNKFLVTDDEPLTIKGVIGLFMKQYDDFDTEIKNSDGFSPSAIIDRVLIKVAKGKLRRNLNHLSALAKAQDLTQSYCIAKYMCKNCPKTANMINSGEISTLAQFWISFNTELLAK